MAAHRIDLTGKKFGRLTAIRFDRKGDGNRSLYWLCKCECGNEISTTVAHLNNGSTNSCGCLARDIRRKQLFKHGLTHTSEFRAWENAIERCTNPNHQVFFNYGMRGISVCERWLHSFQNFIDDMGKKPTPKHTLDRIDNNGNYCKENCRWTTMKVQQGNRRDNHWIEHDGRKMILADWANELQVDASYLGNYLKRGRSMKDAIEYYTKKIQHGC